MPETVLNPDEAMVQEMLPAAAHMVAILQGNGVPNDKAGQLIGHSLAVAARILAEQASNGDQELHEVPISQEDSANPKDITNAHVAEEMLSVQPKDTITNSQLAKIEIEPRVIKPGHEFSFMIGPQEIAKAENLGPESPPRAITGIIAIIRPVLDDGIGLLGKPDDAPQVCGPDLYITDVSAMRHQEAEDLIDETAMEIAQQFPDENQDEFAGQCKSFIKSHPFKILIAGSPGLTAEGQETNFLFSGANGGVMTTYPYLEVLVSGSTDPNDFQVRFSAEGPPELEQGVILPLGMLSLKNNVITASPYIEPGLLRKPFPRFDIYTYQSEYEVPAEHVQAETVKLAATAATSQPVKEMGQNSIKASPQEDDEQDQPDRAAPWYPARADLPSRRSKRKGGNGMPSSIRIAPPGR